VNILELARSSAGHVIAIIDDPKEGVTKLLVTHPDCEHAVVLDFDSLVSSETLNVGGPKEAKRLAEQLDLRLREDSE
jgi:hypothetical protein